MIFLFNLLKFVFINNQIKLGFIQSYFVINCFFYFFQLCFKPMTVQYFAAKTREVR